MRADSLRSTRENINLFSTKLNIDLMTRSRTYDYDTGYRVGFQPSASRVQIETEGFEHDGIAF